jgi:hypothetical protein
MAETADRLVDFVFLRIPLGAVAPHTGLPLAHDVPVISDGLRIFTMTLSALESAELHFGTSLKKYFKANCMILGS